RARPPRHERGLVVFMTGLSGSGKSTIARDLRDELAERGDRSVSLLDGDLVRRLLSAGLTFSRADRDLNIARIGFVAAEIAPHRAAPLAASPRAHTIPGDRLRPAGRRYRCAIAVVPTPSMCHRWCSSAGNHLSRRPRPWRPRRSGCRTPRPAPAGRGTWPTAT